MNIPKKDLHVETMRGTGPGGQKRNKTDTACRITHLPTGISAYADERSQKHSKRKAMEVLIERLKERTASAQAEAKKARRDDKVKNPERAIRTYDFKSGVVYDHQQGTKASLKDVLFKGKLNLLRKK